MADLLRQYLDITADRVDRTTLTAALHMARVKSGNYYIAHPLRLGAIAGRAPSELVRALGARAPLHALIEEVTHGGAP